jgi:predicted nucleic acid-binding protein
LTDCSAMNAMDAVGIRDVLTNDHHFEQEGFNVLIKKL